MGHHEPPSLLIFVLCTIFTILAFTYGAYGRICIKAKRSQRPPQPQRRIVRRRSHNSKEENSTLCRRYICNGKRKFICSTTSVLLRRLFCCSMSSRMSSHCTIEEKDGIKAILLRVRIRSEKEEVLGAVIAILENQLPFLILKWQNIEPNFDWYYIL